jgi:hypothetical protein
MNEADFLRLAARRARLFALVNLFFALVLQSAIPTEALAQNAYAEAQRAFQARDYSNSARLFYSLSIASAGDVRAKAEFGLAESLKKSGYPYSAAYFYARIVAQGNKSDFFRYALENLGESNSKSALGRAAIAGIFGAKIDPLQVPPGARGFYFFYKGLEAFDNGGASAANIGGGASAPEGLQAVAKARFEFERVPSGNPYYPRAQYYLGVILSVMKDTDGSLSAFSNVIKTTTGENLKQLATLGLARVNYERKDYRRAFSYFSQIPRDSDLWLETLFEGAWAFFMIQKHNNTLGNNHTIHSPFFVNRFYPETYILNAITYLRLCRYEALRDQLRKFQERYKPTFADLNNLLKKYQGNPEAFYSVIARYRSTGKLGESNASTEVIDSVSRSDAFKEAALVAKAMEREASALKSNSAKWEMSGLADVLRQSFEARRKATIRAAGETLFNQAVQQFRYLRDLSDQTRLINLEMLSGRTDQLRARFNPETQTSDGTSWGEGMKPLSLKSEIEYWPFQGEYWEDELGGYVYNIDSVCKAGTSAKK